MVVKVPYNYLILQAFQNLIKYEERKEITVGRINNYLNAVLEETLSLYYHSRNKGESSDWQGEVKYSYDKDYLKKFLAKYDIVSIIDNYNSTSNPFNLNDNILKLKDSVTYEELENLINKVVIEEKVSNRFVLLSEHLPSLKTLGITKCLKIIDSFLNQEQEIEKFYYSNNIDDKLMAFYSFKRIMFLNNLNQKAEYTLLGYQNILCEMQIENEESTNFFPINWEKYVNSPWGKNDVDITYSKLKDSFHKAIFGKFPLFYEKSLMMMEDIIASRMALGLSSIEAEEIDEMEEEETDFDIIESQAFFDTQDIIFYVTYLEKLNDYINQYLIYLKPEEQSDLLNTKTRLIYIFDDPNISLLDEEILKEYMETTNNSEGLDFEEFASEIYYYITDIFEEEQEYTKIIKKILYISAYYELTLDENIVKYLNKYYLNKNYNAYCNAIFDGEYPQKLKRNI